MPNRMLVQALTTGRARDYLQMARPLLRSLELTHHFELEVVTDPAALSLTRARVILAASDQTLAPGQAEELTAFVRRGGGVVLMGGTLAAWNTQGAIGELARWAPSGPGPMTELVLAVEPLHPVTARLGPELRLTDELYLSEGPPADASVLLRTKWQFTDQVVAYEREVGEGRFINLGLGNSASTHEDVSFQKLVHRSLLFAASRTREGTWRRANGVCRPTRPWARCWTTRRSAWWSSGRHRWLIPTQCWQRWPLARTSCARSPSRCGWTRSTG